jgi:F-type H+-transporting ATPase subunit epsilon
MKIKLKIITPEKEIFSEEVDQATFTTKDGEITVLSHHIPLITILVPGELRYKKNGQESILAVAGGFVEVKPDNSVSVLADTAEYAGEIDLTQAKEAHQRAQKVMQKARDKEAVDYTALQSVLEKELNRIRVGKKYRKPSKQPQVKTEEV